MKRKVLLAGALFLVLGVIGLVSQQDRSGPQGAVLTGVWYWQNLMPSPPLPPGLILPSVLTFHNDGTVFCSDALAFGGISNNPNRYTPFYGVWERMGPNEFRATWLTLRFDGLTGMLLGIGRSRAKFAFSSDFDNFEGTMHLDFLPCVGGNPFMCPDPLLAQDSDWQPWSLTSPSDYSFKAARISVVPY